MSASQRIFAQLMPAHLLASLLLTLALPPAALAANCKGLSASACAGNSACTWVSSYTTKKGTTVGAYCRVKSRKAAQTGEKKGFTKTKPAKSEKNNKADKSAASAKDSATAKADKKKAAKKTSAGTTASGKAKKTSDKKSSKKSSKDKAKTSSKKSSSSKAKKASSSKK